MPEYKTNGTQQQCGHALGVLCMDEYLPFPPGCVNNASTFAYPVLHKLVPGWHSTDVVTGDTEKYLETLIAKARELEADGVRAITANCGYAIQHQDEVAAAVGIPVALSSLLSLPIISSSLRSSQAIGILCTAAPPMTTEFIQESGISVPNQLLIRGLIDEPGFRKLAAACGLAQDATSDLISLDFDEICADLVNVAARLQEENPHMGAILLECSEFPPYASAVQAVTGLPVFDFITLADFVHSATHPRQLLGQL